jgi:hypothetical protein
MSDKQGRTAAKCIERAINTALNAVATTNGLMFELMNGKDKIITFEWNGDLLDLDNRDNFDKSRGDGRVRIIYKGEPSYQVPPSVDIDDADFNVRAGVPLWLLNTSTARPIALGIGVMHPRYSSATMVIYDHVSDLKIATTYFGDPRHSTHLPWPEGLENYDEQIAWIEENGGSLQPTPVRRPIFVAPWPWTQGISS